LWDLFIDGSFALIPSKAAGGISHQRQDGRQDSRVLTVFFFAAWGAAVALL